MTTFNLPWTVREVGTRSWFNISLPVVVRRLAGGLLAILICRQLCLAEARRLARRHRFTITLTDHTFGKSGVVSRPRIVHPLSGKKSVVEKCLSTGCIELAHAGIGVRKQAFLAIAASTNHCWCASGQSKGRQALASSKFQDTVDPTCAS